MRFPYEEFDLSGVRTYPLQVAREQGAGGGLRPALRQGLGRGGVRCAACLDMLAAADFTAVVEAIRSAQAPGGGIVWGLGAHVIKTGLSPVLIDLMERGFVSAIATNGAGIIHDFEIALAGATSEDVDDALGPGRFGMAEETGRLLNGAINDGVAAGLGIGQAVGDVPRAAPPAARAREHRGRGGAPRRSR